MAVQAAEPAARAVHDSRVAQASPALEKAAGVCEAGSLAVVGSMTEEAGGKEGSLEVVGSCVHVEMMVEGAPVSQEGSAAATAAAAAGVGGLQEVAGTAADLREDQCSCITGCDRCRRLPIGTTGPSVRPVLRSGSRIAPQSRRLRAHCRVGIWAGKAVVATRTSCAH